MLVRQLAEDSAIAAADTLLLTVPNQLGVEYNAHVIESVLTHVAPEIDLAARAAVAARTEELFRASGALREGHFQLKSGRHGDAYVEKFAVLADPAATSELVGYWVARLRGETGATEESRPRSTSSPDRRLAG